MTEKVAGIVKKRARPVRLSEVEEASSLTEEDYDVLEREYNM